MSEKHDKDKWWLECNRCSDCGVEMRSKQCDSLAKAVKKALEDGWRYNGVTGWAKCPDCQSYA